MVMAPGVGRAHWLESQLCCFWEGGLEQLTPPLGLTVLICTKGQVWEGDSTSSPGTCPLHTEKR
jgi:hypothetical protein